MINRSLGPYLKHSHHLDTHKLVVHRYSITVLTHNNDEPATASHNFEIRIKFTVDIDISD